LVGGQYGSFTIFAVYLRFPAVLCGRRTNGVNLIGNLGGGDDDTACGLKFESLIHIIGHDKTSTRLKTTYIIQKQNDYVIK